VHQALLAAVFLGHYANNSSFTGSGNKDGSLHNVTNGEVDATVIGVDVLPINHIVLHPGTARSTSTAERTIEPTCKKQLDPNAPEPSNC
jgi:hypothetical protein